MANDKGIENLGYIKSFSWFNFSPTTMHSQFASNTSMYVLAEQILIF